MHSGKGAYFAAPSVDAMSAGLEWNENVPFTGPKNSEMRMLGSADLGDKFGTITVVVLCFLRLSLQRRLTGTR